MRDHLSWKTRNHFLHPYFVIHWPLFPSDLHFYLKTNFNEMESKWKGNDQQLLQLTSFPRHHTREEHKQDGIKCLGETAQAKIQEVSSFPAVVHQAVQNKNKKTNIKLLRWGPGTGVYNRFYARSNLAPGLLRTLVINWIKFDKIVLMVCLTSLHSVFRTVLFAITNWICFWVYQCFFCIQVWVKWAPVLRDYFLRVPWVFS